MLTRSVAAIPSPLASFHVRSRFADAMTSIAVTAGVALVALIAAYLLLHHSFVLAVGFVAVPLVALAFVRPAAGLVVLGAAIPIQYSVGGGSAGLHVAPSDLLLVLVGGAILLRPLVYGRSAELAALRPVKGSVAQYVAFVVVLVFAHLSKSDVVQAGQRIELIVLPLVVGAYAAYQGRHLGVLKAYLISATALAALWPFFSSLGQKNPVGQMIANAILLLVGVRALRRYVWCGLILAPGLLLTGSRGAILAAAVGTLLILALQESRARLFFARISVLVALAVVTYASLPVAQQTRLTTFHGGTRSSGQYAIHVRQQYAADAKRIIAAHPVAGVGVGNYFAGNPYNGTNSTDPHDVILLQAAEGGYGFAVSFVLLIAGAAFALAKLRGVDVRAVAAGVFAATVAHGLVDVYWVRGTPVLSWLLLGMLCGGFARVHAPRAETDAA